MKRDNISNEINAADALAKPQKTSALAWLNRWHKKLAWIAGIAVILWGLTGVLHPMMSALSPKPHPLPPALSLPSDLQPISPRQLPLAAEQVQSLRLRMWGDTPAWRVGVVDQAVGQWFDARNGQRIANADSIEAERLARALVGDAHTPIRQISVVTQFSASYPSINKILPVWQVEFERDDGMIAFVDTEGQRLASLSDQTKRTLMPIFATLHTWSWTDEAVRKVGITLVLTMAMLSMLGGLAMYWLRYRRQTLKATQPALRRFHRGLGLVAGVTGLLITGSGLTHLWLQRAPFAAAKPAPLALLPDLNAIPAGTKSLVAVKVDSTGYWLLDQARNEVQSHTAHQHHQPAKASNPLPRYLNTDGLDQSGIAERHALYLLHQLAPNEASVQTARLKSLSVISQFGGEYGFFQKRLPVYRLDLAADNHASWYIEPATGAFSTRIEDQDRFEGYLFANLHKWHWLDGLGKTARDVILAGFAALNVILAVFGLGLLRRKKRAA